ncbi:MAG: hypothetical protein ACYDHH_01410 [Solirubrobacteraceae bacterium]
MSARVALLALVVSFVVVAQAGAAMVSFGPDLAAGPAPTLDTANGATEAHFEEPLSVYNAIHGGDAGADVGMTTSFRAGCTHTYSPDVANYPCTSAMHSGADNTIWNTGAGAGAPQGGQALQINVKGCTVEDTTPGNSQLSPGGAGVNYPANTIEFQSLTPQSGGSYKVNGTAGLFQLPFCSNSASPADRAGAINTSTVTSFTPLHLCLKPGDIVSFYDIGGSVPNLAKGDLFYPQGAPFMVIAPVTGATTDSFTDSDAAPGGTYAAGATPGGPRGDNSGWGQQSGQQVMLSVVEGVGDDAYGLCPGGLANESATSNTVNCVYHQTNPGDPYPSCDGAGNPFRPPVNTSPPTISGTAQVGSTLTEGHGAWTNSPASYRFQWQQCDSTGASCQPISGATSTTYKVASGDAGDTLIVQETATNPANTEGPVSSAPTAVVTAGSGGGGGGGGGGGSSKFSIGKLRLAKYAFRAAKGTTISYQDSRAGTTTLTVTGRGKHKALWTQTHHDTAGTNTIKFRDKKLRKGFYTLTITTSFGGQTASVSLTMRIVT